MLKIGLVGLGYWGSKLARAIERTPNMSLTAVIDGSTKALAGHRTIAPDVRGYTSVEAALEDATLDAMVVATPAATHFTVGSLCLEGGKDLLIEKPLALSTSEGDKLVNLAAEQGRVLMVGHTFLYNPAVARAKKLLTIGSLGDLQYMSFVRTNLGPLRADANVVWDLAAHDVAVSLWLAGHVPLSVSAVGGTWINSGTPDLASIWLGFPAGIKAQIQVSWLSPERRRNIQVVGSAGMLTIDDSNQATPLVSHAKFVPKNHETSEGAVLRLSTVDEGSVVVDVTWSEPLVNELSAFAEAVIRRSAPLSDGVFGSEVVKVLEAAQMSMESEGTPVLFD